MIAFACGNCEIAGADVEMVRDIVKRAGDRLRAAGFQDVTFMVPNEETVERSIAVAEVILADSDARQYVATVGYHVYPYGSPYASVPRILSDSGRGMPDAASVQQRRRLRDLCQRYGLPTWMTEVSHLADNDSRAMLITGMGYAIGHYARWLNRGRHACGGHQ